MSDEDDYILMYPVLLMELESGDLGFDDGYKYLIEQADGDRHWFRTFDGIHGAERFLELHGMKPVTSAEMSSIRMAYNLPDSDAGV